MNQTEKVLCIPRDRLPADWVEKESVTPLGFEDFIRRCSACGFEFIDRSKAETEAEFKQIIPYIMLQTHDTRLTGVYNRNGSEARLHDLWSLGVGGHINPVDEEPSGTGFKEILVSGMQRELSEEFDQMAAADTPEFLGVISEDVTEVGRVHLGAVFRILTRTPGAYIPGPELKRFQWIPTEKLCDLKMELWSSLVLKLLSKG